MVTEGTVLFSMCPLLLVKLSFPPEEFFTDVALALFYNAFGSIGFAASGLLAVTVFMSVKVAGLVATGAGDDVGTEGLLSDFM